MNEFTIKAKSFEVHSVDGTLIVTVDEPTEGAVTITDAKNLKNSIELMFSELIACSNLISQVMGEKIAQPDTTCKKELKNKS